MVIFILGPPAKKIPAKQERRHLYAWLSGIFMLADIGGLWKGSDSVGIEFEKNTWGKGI